jgi:hypothetical protein
VQHKEMFQWECPLLCSVMAALISAVYQSSRLLPYLCTSDSSLGNLLLQLQQQ